MIGVGNCMFVCRLILAQCMDPFKGSVQAETHTFAHLQMWNSSLVPTQVSTLTIMIHVSAASASCDSKHTSDCFSAQMESNPLWRVTIEKSARSFFLFSSGFLEGPTPTPLSLLDSHGNIYPHCWPLFTLYGWSMWLSCRLFDSSHNLLLRSA